MTGGACHLLIGFNCSHVSANSWTLPPSAMEQTHKLRDIPGIKFPPPPRINRGNAVQHTLWISPHDDTMSQLFASTMQVVQFLSEAMNQRITYVHRYPRLSARDTPDHAYLKNALIPQTWEYPPPVCFPSHSHYFMMSTTSSQAAVRERHDLRASAVREGHHHLRPRRPSENGRKPIGRNPRDSAYRLSSRLLRSRPPRARSLSRSLSDLLRSSRLRSRSRSSESSPRRSRASRSSSRRGRYLRLLDSRESLVSTVLTDLREGVRDTSESRRPVPRREFVTIWLRASNAEASSPFLLKSLTCLFSTLSGDIVRIAFTTELSGNTRK